MAELAYSLPSLSHFKAGMILRKRMVKRDRKQQDNKGSQMAAAKSWLSHLKRPQVLVPVSLLVVVLILFKVEKKDSRWQVNTRDWTGFGQSYDENVSEVTETGTETTGTSKKETTKTTTTTKRLQPAKTLWDWMALLLAPATLAGLGFLFQSSQEKAKQDKEEADKARDANQQREQALQTYFDQLSELLVNKQLKKVLAAKPANVDTSTSTEAGAEVSVTTEVEKAKTETVMDAEAALDVVKAKTLALLRMFAEDIPRAASVLSFLSDTDLLRQMDLNLSYIPLEGAILRKVNFSNCQLYGAKLQRARFSGANLSHASLDDADLSHAEISNADLSHASLCRTNFGHASLHSANLNRAFLYSANLSYTDLRLAEFSNADLCGADLRGANLLKADFSHAKFWDSEFGSPSDFITKDYRDAYLDLIKNLAKKDYRGAYLDLIKKDTVVRIQSTTNWQNARYDPEMRELLGLPPESVESKATD